MLDAREGILDDNWESRLIPNDHPDSIIITKQEIYNAMDENGKQMCLALLEYMALNLVICGHWSSADGKLFQYKGRLITKEQLFENFL